MRQLNSYELRALINDRISHMQTEINTSYILSRLEDDAKKILDYIEELYTLLES